MTNPTRAFDSVRNAYLRYFDSPFDLRFEELVQARRRLLDRDGILYREPLIEPQPPYIVTAHDIRSAAATLASDGQWNAEIADDLADLAERGLFRPRNGKPMRLYEHQLAMFRSTLIRHRDTVVLTGTGSGKTEAIYLPILAALAKESAAWPAAPTPPPNDWWAMPPPAGSRNTRNHPRIAQRAHEDGCRPAAMRALVLYPLNALAEDQMARLRAALDGDKVRHWLQANRSGNRFWFGRYTGWTPVAGHPTPIRVDDLRRELRQRSLMAQNVAGDAAARFFPRFDGGEMWSRWDMQASPPDILITNYSMLNVMLMRDIEAPIFEATRRWLSADPGNVFHLVVDELHTYRGTPGTEVGYILRVLYDRLGLDPDHAQLRILASSASIGDDDEQAQAYLHRFFGRSLGFDLVRGAIRPFPQSAHRNLRSLARPFAHFGEKSLEPEALSPAIDELTRDLTDLPPDAQTGPERRLDAALAVSGAPDALRAACNIGTAESPVTVPRTIASLGEVLFPGEPTLQRSAAVEGLVAALTLARTADGDAPLPLRVHMFFRNVQGIWACTNPGCTVCAWSDPDIPIGRLYTRPTMTCECGSRVLEMLYCEPCGEVFLGGYRRRLLPDANAWALLPDDPNLERLPDRSADTRSYHNYAVYWPARLPGGALREPQRSEWTQDGVRRAWRKSHYDHTTGEIRLATRNVQTTGWVYHVRQLHRNPPHRNAPASAANERPALCPHCEANWSGMGTSPIRTQRTGFQKVAQILSDALLREIAPTSKLPNTTDEDERRKLVLFADSRQDAAKLAVGVAKSHWLDALRQAVVEGMHDVTTGPIAFERQARGETLSHEDNLLALRFRTSHPHDALAIEYAQGERRGLPSHLPRMTMRDAAELVLGQAKAGLSRAAHLEAEASRRLLQAGMNPGGVERSIAWTDLDEEEGPWRDLFDWEQNPPDFRQFLSPAQADHRTRIREAARVAIVETLFAGGRRDLESLGLGYVTFDRAFDPALPDSVREAADGCIRLFGRRRRADTHHATLDDDDLPKYARDYLQAVAEANGVAPQVFERQVHDLLTATGVYSQGLLHFDNLYVATGSLAVYQCGRCTRLHLHRSGGVCSECRAPFDNRPLTTTPIADDYYRWLATDAGAIFRLNCAELTGQTDKVVARERQRLFQNISVGRERPLTDHIDLLSVTTTMEAGVDIGALLAVMMSNMPPMRFNYQQRVGRSGRRGAPLSLALTLCRGRSHDDYYFQRPDRITADPPPSPYVDTARPQIFRRVLAKEVLRLAFSELGLNPTGSTDSVHGEFGSADNWTQPPENPVPGYRAAVVSDIVQEWIGRRLTRVQDLSSALLVGTELAEEPRHAQEAVDWVANRMVDAVTAAASDEGLVQTSLSERLANHGVLPMFGFPTRARRLYHKRPQHWPPRHVVDRDLELAVSMFAPGAETVKEGAIHTAIGVADYRRAGRKVVDAADPLGPSVEVGLCRRCEHIETVDPHLPACPVCGSPADSGEGSYRVVDLRQPKGFISYFSRARDYDGAFEFSPRAARPKLGRASFSTNTHLNFDVGAGPSRLHVINDNAGRLFSFSPQPWAGGHGLVDVDAANSADRRHAIANRRPPSPPLTPSGTTTECALAAICETDTMLLGIHDYGPGNQADPSTLEGRAALYSLAFMLRRAAAVYLDIQDYELKAGIRTLPTAASSAPIVGQVFLSDTLENGAGYATHLGNPATTRHLLEMIAQPTNTRFHQQLVVPSHADSCVASCPDCMRSYSNLAYHGLLDWRLALDLADLALDPAMGFSLSTPRWQGLTTIAAASLHASRPNHSRSTFAGIPAIHDCVQAVLLVHPLWSTTHDNPHPLVGAAYREAAASGIETTAAVSVFEALRRPA